MYNGELPDNLGDFGELLRRVFSGEKVILSQGGTPVAGILPFSQQQLPRIPGLDRGKVVIASDFNSPLPEDILKDCLHPLDVKNHSIT